MQMSKNKSEVEAANAKFVSSFKDGDKVMPPARHATIVTCMDARLHPEKFLGADIGAHACLFLTTLAFATDQA